MWQVPTASMKQFNKQTKVYYYGNKRDLKCISITHSTKQTKLSF